MSRCTTVLCVILCLLGSGSGIGVRGSRTGPAISLSYIEPAAPRFLPASPPTPRDRARLALDASQNTILAIEDAIGSIVRDVSDWQEQSAVSAGSGVSETVASLLVEQLPRDREALAQVHRSMEFLESRWARAQSLRAEAVRTASGQATVEATRRTLGRAAESASVAYLMRNVAASQQAEGAVSALLSELAPLQRAALAWRQRIEQEAGRAAENERAKLLAALGTVNATRSQVQSTYSIAGAAGRILERIARAEASARSKGILEAFGLLGVLQQCRILSAAPSGDVAPSTSISATLADKNGSTTVAIRIQADAGASWPEHSLPSRLDLDVLSVSSEEQCKGDWAALREQYPELARSMRALSDAAAAAVAAEATARAATAAGLAAQARAAQKWQVAANGTSAQGGMLDAADAAQAALDSILRAMRSALAAGAAHRLGLDESMRRPSEALDAEADTVDQQAARLRAARQVLERELALRQERWRNGLGFGIGMGTGRDPVAEVVAATTPLMGGEGSSISPAASDGDRGSLESDGDTAAARAAREVAGQLEGTALARSSQAIGVPAAAALVAHRPDQLWREAQTLSLEADKVRKERLRCLSHPLEYRQGCAGRMQWEADRLVDEAARRRAAVAGQAAAAAEVAREVRAARDECDRRGGGLSTKGVKGAQEVCGPEQRAALTGRLSRLSAWMSAARAWREEWTERGSLRCLWERRNTTVAALVAKSLEQPPVEEPGSRSETGNGEGKEEEERDTEGAIGNVALDPAVAGPRLRRLLQVCSALRGPAVSKQSGAEDLAGCLCSEAEAERKLLLRAEVLARRSAAARDAQASASSQAQAEAERTRAAAATAAELKAKSAVFEYLRSRGKLDDVLRDAMAGTHGEGTAAAA